jgi:hypothetical protein
MDWMIKDVDYSPKDTTGVEGFVNRMETELRGEGPPLEGFHFLNSPSEMLRFSREIEDEVRSNPQKANLYVGFQTVEKMLAEAGRYRQLNELGVSVVTFGQGELPESMEFEGSTWVPLNRDTRSLANQWYLISSSPTPIAFVAWEVSVEEQFAIGGLSAPGKLFKGFVTNDLRVINGLIGHLDSVMNQKAAIQDSRAAIESQLRLPINKIMTITQIEDSKSLKDLRSRVTELASGHEAELILFEMSAASYLVTPYPEENRDSWKRVLNENDLNLFGRSAIAKQINEISSAGVSAGVVLPTTHGFKHLTEWAEKEKIDLIVIPVSMVDPGLLDRLKGYSLRTLLDNTDIQLVVMETDGTMWNANPQLTENAFSINNDNLVGSSTRNLS